MSKEWKEFLTNSSKQSEKQEPVVLLYVYHLASIMIQLLVKVQLSLQKTIVHDVRYQDQLYEFQRQIESLHQECSQLLVVYDGKIKLLGYFHYPCRKNDPFHRCHYYPPRHVYQTTTCSSILKDLENTVVLILSFLCENIASPFYYVRRLYQQGRFHQFPLFLNMDVMKPLSDIQSWEVICEDENTQYLSHPCLSHPLDFLVKKKYLEDNQTSSYLQKARFEYQVQSYHDKYVVVLDKSPSKIPKLQHTLYQEEKVLIQHESSSFTTSLYQESIRHSFCHNKKKRPLSRILKETRKKNKTFHRRITFKEIIPSIDDVVDVEFDDDYYLLPDDPPYDNYSDDYDYDYEYEYYYSSYYYD